MMFDDLLPISALQHLLFCERQAMLIHLERQWAESRLTVEGQQLHRRAHREQSGWRGGVFIARGLQLASNDLGLFGRADIVEFRPPAGIANGTAASGANESPPTVQVSGRDLPVQLRGAALRGWSVVPIEYKRGKPKANDCDRVQLCAQAMCLEEMLQIEIPCGEIFYGLRRRRVDVPMDAALREKTRAAAGRLSSLFAAQITPSARREPKCDACSLVHLCLPTAAGQGARAGKMTAAAFADHLAGAGPSTDHQLELQPT